MADAGAESDALRAQVAVLTEQLESERRRTARLQSDVKRLQENFVETHLRLESEEEAITNQLLQRIDRLKSEKDAVVAAVEIEEEALTNGLMKQLTTLMKEKQALERELQHEHELHEAGMKELSIAFSERVSERSKLKTERCQLENLLEAEQESIIHRAHGQISLLLRDNAKLKRECDRLRGLGVSRGVSRSVSPALSHGHPSPAASPRTQIADPPATALP